MKDGQTDNQELLNLMSNLKEQHTVQLQDVNCRSQLKLLDKVEHEMVKNFI